MAMGEARTGSETLQLQMVCLDELVAADDRYRRIERVISWRAVRASAAPFYAVDGRPSVDPAVLLKLFLVAAIEGRHAMRDTLRVAERDLAVRRFLGYGLTERLPSHATVSYAQCVRFASSSVFEQLFVQVLSQCREAGLLDGTRLVVDATHVEANAALSSLRADLAVVESAEPSAGSDAGSGAGPGVPASVDGPASAAALRVAPYQGGKLPKRQARNATAVSTTDPDAALRYKPGQRSHLQHRVQVATDPKRRVIVAVVAERVTGSEAAALPELIRRARFAGHAVREVCADRGYASDASYAMLEKLDVEAFIPPQRVMLKNGVGANAAYRRMRTARGISATLDRMSHGEGAISELKGCHALDRVRCRGTGRVHIQALVAATAVNLKRLLQYGPAPITPATSATGTRQNASNTPGDAPDRRRRALRRSQLSTSRLLPSLRQRWKHLLTFIPTASLTAS